MFAANCPHCIEDELSYKVIHWGPELVTSVCAIYKICVGSFSVNVIIWKHSACEDPVSHYDSKSHLWTWTSLITQEGSIMKIPSIYDNMALFFLWVKICQWPTKLMNCLSILFFIYSFIIISLLIYTINNKPHHTTLYKYKCQNIHDIALSCDQNIHAIVVLISCLVKYSFMHAQLYAIYVMLVFVLSRRTPGHITYDGLLFFLPNVSNQYLLNKVYNHKTENGKNQNHMQVYVYQDFILYALYKIIGCYLSKTHNTYHFL